MALHPGDFLNQYRIESLVARSGMASIYKATDMQTNQPVAIKIPVTGSYSLRSQDSRFYQTRLRRAPNSALAR